VFQGGYGKILPYFSTKYQCFSFQEEECLMFANCSVLIVDDDSFARGIIRHHLARLGFKNIFEVSDGEQALATLRSARMQLVIADRYMPVLNGLELFCGIQSDPALKDIPFVMITIEDNRARIEDAAKLGICHYLVKPFNAKVFDAKVHEVLFQPVPETLSE
jgi:two-component system, chemotaxis family, chemotaxis protein CheY